MIAAGLLVIASNVVLLDWQSNKTAIAEADQLMQSSHTSKSRKTVSVPSTDKPAPAAVNSYSVAADHARYLTIPKLGVHARVLSVSTTSDGAIGTPANIYDTAWYSGSALPGQSGATLIDGHISSWTSHGVFYGLKQLAPGDTVQIERGDGQIITYRVMKIQTYDADSVDMNAALSPITPGTSGLNLISCSGDVEAGSNEFNQRIVVFTEQMSD